MKRAAILGLAFCAALLVAGVTVKRGPGDTDVGFAHTAAAGGDCAASATNSCVWQVSCPTTCWVQWQASSSAPAGTTYGFRIATPLGAPYSGTAVTLYPSGTTIDAAVTHGLLDSPPTSDVPVGYLGYGATPYTPLMRIDAGNSLQMWTLVDNQNISLSVVVYQ